MKPRNSSTSSKRDTKPSTNLTRMNLSELKKLVRRKGISIPKEYDKRFKSTYLAVLGVPGYVGANSKKGKVDFISKWDWAWKTNNDKDSERWISECSDQDILNGFHNLLKTCEGKRIRRVFYVVLKTKDYLLEELVDLVLGVKPYNFNLRDLKLIVTEVMSDLEDEGPVLVTAHELLGVEKSVSKKELKERYRQLCMQHHPDASGSDNYDYFNQITHAYQEILGDMTRRERRSSNKAQKNKAA